MKKKRAAVVDGRTVLHQAERRFHQLLHHAVVTSRLGGPATAGANDTDSNRPADTRQDKICVAGWHEPTVQWIAQALQAGPYHTNRDAIDTVMLNDDVTADFTDARYILLCIEMTSIRASPDTLRNMYQAVQHVLSHHVRVCCALVGTEDEYKGSLHKVYRQYPELRWLSHKHLITMVNLNIDFADQRIDSYTREGLRNWLVHKPPSLKSEHEDVMDYIDIFRIVSREMKLHLPEVVTLLRLLLMCVAGCVWVLGTVILLIAITGEVGYEKDLTAAKESLSSRIARTRTGKAEWGWRSNAGALTALQLHDRSWCFQNLENQRSVDRMEIGLLAAISRSRTTLSREITLIQLASHVNALLVTYQNPRDFYGHDLVANLESHVVQQVPFTKHNVFAHSFAVISLYNAGVQIERRHVEKLLVKQREDGSYTHGVDECAIAALAFASGSHEADLELAMRRTVSYIVKHRRPDGSYGSVYATALSLQALNASQTILSPRDHDKTVTWLLNRVDRDPSLRTIDVSSQVLIALSGKTMLGARFFSAKAPEKNAVALRNPVPIYIKTDDSEGDDPSSNGSNDNVAKSDDSRHLLQDHVDTRARELNATRREEGVNDEVNKKVTDTEEKDTIEKDEDEDEDDHSQDRLVPL